MSAARRVGPAPANTPARVERMLRLPAPLNRRLAAEAKRSHRSANAEATIAIEEYLDRRKDERK